MNQFTEFKKVTKLDYHGQPYEATVAVDNNPDLAQLWKRFMEDFNNQPPRPPGGHEPINEDQVNKYFENLNNML